MTSIHIKHITASKEESSPVHVREERSGEGLLVTILALGEGWHDYHHTFPWDSSRSSVGAVPLSA